MRLLTSLDQLSTACAAGTALTIGMFDGVHRGHQMLIAKAREHALADGLQSLALTFSNHPLSLLAPPYAPRLLSSAEEKARYLAECGLDLCAMLDFTAEFAAMPAESFLNEVVVQRCRARYLVCGPDFRFGAQGQGDADMLRTRSADFDIELEICGALLDAGLPVRSTRVRNALLEGRVAEAARLLGRPYSLNGTVARGDQRGRTIGYPTANLQIEDTRLIPQYGVYAIRARLPAGKTPLGGMLNIGTRPTFDLFQRTVEAHLFDFSGDLYNQTLTLEFVSKVRDEHKFASVAELIEQLRSDEATCRAILATNGS